MLKLTPSNEEKNDSDCCWKKVKRNNQASSAQHFYDPNNSSGFNNVICDDGSCELPLNSMSSILQPASSDLPLITSKDLDGNPPLKESSIGHYEGKQQDAHQTKKASSHATSEISAFCGNDFMTDCRRKVSVMTWKGLRAKIAKELETLKGQLDDSLSLEKEAIANSSFVEDELIEIEEELARLTSRKKVLESSLEEMKSDVLEKQSMVSKIYEKISKVEAMPIRIAEDDQSLSTLQKLLFDRCNELEQFECNP
ncbi:hypothetical protein JCGZ_15559 [Jatropha curcas]|uniref:Uncharacterized protein n=1 Tax=Jatropha curcas TaxID=180498 RepID=A0A067KF30_JATCU|nr:hypothetical protein JCGZ_15559 [Jatropha curcas]